LNTNEEIVAVFAPANTVSDNSSIISNYDALSNCLGIVPYTLEV